MREAAKAYAEWAQHREPFLQRARDGSALTIPSLIPRQAQTASDKLDTPFQGLGAQGVNNLASKLVLSLFPTVQPFFRILPADPALVNTLPPEAQSEVEENLARVERAVLAALEVAAIRVKVFEALKHLITAGNVVLHVQEDMKSRVIPLDQYVARRDPMGTLECLIVREQLARDTLPPELRKLVDGSFPDTQPIPAPSAPTPDRVSMRTDVVDLYTCLEWDAQTGSYHLHQELDGRLVPDSPQRVKPDNLPFLVLRYAAIDGEDYGRGMVEEVLGDLVSLEGLMRAIVEAAAISARIVFLVRPTGAAVADDLNRAPNGSFRPGHPDDVTPIQSNKSADLQVAFTAVARIEDRLKQSFLLNSSVQRNAERVTAEEVRFVAQELESALGGVFSVLSQELQLPLVQLFITHLQRQKKIPKLPKKAVRLAIVTGVEALGRGQELQRMSLALQALQSVIGPEAVVQNVEVRALIGRFLTSAGVDTKDLLRSPEAVAADQRMAQMQQYIAQLGPEAIKQLGPGIAQKMGLGAQEKPQSPPPPAA